MGMKWLKNDYLGKIIKDRKQLIQKIGIWRIIIIILAGIVLVIASVTDKSRNNDEYSDNDVYSDGFDEESSDGEEGGSKEALRLSAMSRYAEREERKLEKILGQVEGIGKVKVMITLASSEERMTLQDTDNSESSTSEQDSSGGTRRQEEYSIKSENVIISSDGDETPYVVQVNSPKIEGVAVVAQGAGTGEKDSEIIDAVEVLFSIEPHKIKVMKME